jgi:hypothetical protein
MREIQIRALSPSPDISEMLIGAVANGGSVSFTHRLQLERANAFWENSPVEPARGDQIIVGALEALDLPPNQPHRAEIAKMMARVSRHRGIVTPLMRAAGKLAIERGRTLLVLDTAAE